MAEVLSRTMPNRATPGALFAITVLVLMALALSSCNTFEGMGEDVSAAGGAVSDTAKDVKEEM